MAVSRRSLLKSASLGAAAAGVFAVAGPLGAEADAAPAPAGEPLRDHVVARVRDLSTGEVDLCMGERQVTVKDRTLAEHLARAARS